MTDRRSFLYSARTSPYPLGGRLLKSAAAGWSLLRSQDLILACALLEQHPLSQSGCFTVSLGNQQSAIISRELTRLTWRSRLTSSEWSAVARHQGGRCRRRFWSTPQHTPLVETLGPSVVIPNSVLVKRMVDHYLKPSDLHRHLNAVVVS